MKSLFNLMPAKYTINIVEGIDLPCPVGMDFLDPYVKLISDESSDKLNDKSSDKPKDSSDNRPLKTHHVSNNYKNPVWDRSFQTDCYDDMFIEVWDHDILEDDLVGSFNGKLLVGSWWYLLDNGGQIHIIVSET